MVALPVTQTNHLAMQRTAHSQNRLIIRTALELQTNLDVPAEFSMGATRRTLFNIIEALHSYAMVRPFGRAIFLGHGFCPMWCKYHRRQTGSIKVCIMAPGEKEPFRNCRQEPCPKSSHMPSLTATRLHVEIVGLLFPWTRLSIGFDTVFPTALTAFSQLLIEKTLTYIGAGQ